VELGWRSAWSRAVSEAGRSVRSIVGHWQDRVALTSAAVLTCKRENGVASREPESVSATEECGCASMALQAIEMGLSERAMEMKL
jgi:hypothetical protein